MGEKGKIWGSRYGDVSPPRGKLSMLHDVNSKLNFTISLPGTFWVNVFEYLCFVFCCYCFYLKFLSSSGKLEWDPCIID